VVQTDEKIKSDIVDQIYGDHRVDAAEVQVEVYGGHVTLTGTVPSLTARNAATADAWEIAGVKRVTNLLTVRFPPTFTVPLDREIEDSARVTLSWNPAVHGEAIDVSVTGGVVTLEGTVDAYWKRWKAETLVSDLSGVRDVENRLTVVPTESRLDQQIAEEIEAALVRSLYIDPDRVTVKVEHGQVRLTGSVETYHGRASAYEAAVNAAGVIEIDNDVVVV
jgi:osmotically-inducible protein OsmY